MATETQAENGVVPVPDEGFSLKENLSSGTEKDTTQEAEVEQNQVYDFQVIIAEIDAKMKSIGMTVGIGKKYLKKVYGIESRYLLSDEQLIEFWRYMQRQFDLTNIMYRIA